jgi:hypothetical protein
MAKVKCEDCFKKEDKEKAIKDGWKHFEDVDINGTTLEQNSWLCPECIPQNEGYGQ